MFESQREMAVALCKCLPSDGRALSPLLNTQSNPLRLCPVCAKGQCPLCSVGSRSHIVCVQEGWESLGSSQSVSASGNLSWILELLICILLLYQIRIRIVN